MYILSFDKCWSLRHLCSLQCRESPINLDVFQFPSNMSWSASLHTCNYCCFQPQAAGYLSCSDISDIINDIATAPIAVVFCDIREKAETVCSNPLPRAGRGLIKYETEKSGRVMDVITMSWQNQKGSGERRRELIIGVASHATGAALSSSPEFLAGAEADCV